jgi:hypothetical protein
MMPVHLYGVLDAGAPLAPTKGLDGRVVRVLALGDRCALVSDLDESKLAVTPRRLREHDAVLRDAVAAGRSVVPARLGRLYADDSALTAALETYDSVLAVAMTLVRGRVEMSLLIAGSPSAPPSPLAQGSERGSRGPGREHLLRLQSERQGERNMLHGATELAQVAARALTGIVVAERAVEDPAPPVLVARAHLVARDDISRYLVAVKAVAAASGSTYRLAVRGPGAAYSFAAVQGG